MGTEGTLSPGVMRPGREATSPSSAEVKNGGAIPPVPTRLRGMVIISLIKHRDNFTFAASSKSYVTMIFGDTVGSTVSLHQ
jgi:hypothetical protein